MGTENSQRTLLSSWKEIASYLNCSVRTCRRWEKEYGLPVHRIEGADKSPVYAYKEELDAWLKKKLNNHNYLKKRYQLPVNILRKGCIVVLPLCAIVLGYFLFSNSSKLPAQVQWNEANIVVSDLSAEKLMVWSFDGQEAFTLTLTAEPTRFSKVAMDDVDNDGTPEIVALMNISVKKKKRGWK